MKTWTADTLRALRRACACAKPGDTIALRPNAAYRLRKPVMLPDGVTLAAAGATLFCPDGRSGVVIGNGHIRDARLGGNHFTAWFVAPDGGDDTADGRTAETAWRTTANLIGFRLRPVPCASLAELDTTPGGIYAPRATYAIDFRGHCTAFLGEQAVCEIKGATAALRLGWSQLATA